MKSLIPYPNPTLQQSPLLRSLSEGPSYKTHWRFLVREQYAVKITQSRDESEAFEQILTDEDDSWIKELLLFDSGRSSEKSASIRYALDCHNSQHENPFAWTISAMVIEGCTPSEIAEELGIRPDHVIAYEQIFFDVRRYLDVEFWITRLCHYPESMTGLGEGASRWLITVLERGWDALVFSFSRPQLNLNIPVPAGKRILDRALLATSGRLADYTVGQGMRLVPPTPVERECDARIALLMGKLSPILAKTDCPAADRVKKRKRRVEAAELVAPLSVVERRRLLRLIERTTCDSEIGPEGQNKPSGSS